MPSLWQVRINILFYFHFYDYSISIYFNYPIHRITPYKQLGLRMAEQNGWIYWRASKYIQIYLFIIYASITDVCFSSAYLQNLFYLCFPYELSYYAPKWLITKKITSEHWNTYKTSVSCLSISIYYQFFFYIGKF